MGVGDTLDQCATLLTSDRTTHLEYAHISDLPRAAFKVPSPQKAMSATVEVTESSDGPAQAEVSRHPVSWDLYLNWICPVLATLCLYEHS